VIARLRGTVLEADGDRVVLDVGGVGFEVGVPGPVASQLSHKLGEPASLYTYLHVRDDVLQLYGFASPRERSFFRLLISVSGVGPKVAVAILSAYPVEDLELAVFAADAKRFESIPGIGKKLAQRLLVELKDRIVPGPEVAVGAAGLPGAAAAAALVAARSALMNLGMTITEAEAALKGASPDSPVEELVKHALRKGEM
jgi:Holliday junction DNA helicase RuvA